MQLKQRVRRGLKYWALTLGVLVLLLSLTWAAMGRNRVPPGFVDEIVTLNEGRFHIDDSSLLLVPDPIRKQLKAELLEHSRVIDVGEGLIQPGTGADGQPIPRLKVTTWVSTPFFGSFGADIGHEATFTGGGLKKRYLWAFAAWISVPFLDAYSIA